MKKIFFAAMAATVMLASCSKDNDIDTGGSGGEQATLVINVKSPADTRAVSTSAPQIGDDTSISNYTVFVFSGQSLQKRQDAATTSIAITGITTSANAVYVVANNGTLAIPNEVNTKGKLEAWIGDLNSSASQLSKRWATGTNDTNLDFNTSNEATVTVSMKFIAARITVRVQAMSNYTNTPNNTKSLVIKGVTVLNAGGATKMFSAPMMPTAAELSAATYFTGKAYYAGLNMTGMTYVPPMASYDPQTPKTFLYDNVSNLSKATLEGQYFYFYTFENNATSADKFPTIVTLEAEYDGKLIYYPVHLAKYQTFKSGSVSDKGVERGNSYDITLKLTGDAEYPGDPGGEDDPTVPSIDGKLNVNLTICPWNPMVLLKEF